MITAEQRDKLSGILGSEARGKLAADLLDVVCESEEPSDLPEAAYALIQTAIYLLAEDMRRRRYSLPAIQREVGQRAANAMSGLQPPSRQMLHLVQNLLAGKLSTQS